MGVSSAVRVSETTKLLQCYQGSELPAPSGRAFPSQDYGPDGPAVKITSSEWIDTM
jgi:hypothetical protein